MNKYRGPSPDGSSSEGFTSGFNHEEQSRPDLLKTQDRYLEQLTKLVNFPYDSVLRRRLVGLGNDMYTLLLNQVDQIAHQLREYDVDPVPRASNLVSQLDTEQIRYFDTHHPARQKAQPLTSLEVTKRHNIVVSERNLELPQAMVRIHAQRTHQNLGHYVLGGYTLEWERGRTSLTPPTL